MKISTAINIVPGYHPMNVELRCLWMQDNLDMYRSECKTSPELAAGSARAWWVSSFGLEPSVCEWKYLSGLVQALEHQTHVPRNHNYLADGLGL